MSGKAKPKKPKKKAGGNAANTQAIKGSRIANIEHIRRAIETDNPHDLQSCLAGKNPFRLMFYVSDGYGLGIQTACGLVGAWECLLWLQDIVRAQEYFDDLEGEFIDHFKEDMDTAAELLEHAVRNGYPKAEDALREMLYRLIKISDAGERLHQKQTYYNGSPYYADAEARVLAEEENALFSIAVDVPIPQDSATGEKPKGNIGP